MKRYIASSAILLAIAIVSWGFFSISPYHLKGDITVGEVLERLGAPSNHQPDMSMPGVSIENGKSIVLTGYSYDEKGRKSTKQSKHFTCVACHNIEREDPDLTVVDPQKRLEYVVDKGIPFLQGTTFYGTYDHISFYNGDYQKKYGDLVDVAKNDIRQAIQVCAISCSQGRPMKKWEIESVLAYFQSIGLKVDDLDLSKQELAKVEKAIESGMNKNESIALIKSKYLQYSPATFALPPENRTEGYPLTGDPVNGKLIYDNSCLYCHQNGQFSFYKLDNSAYSFNFLDKHIPKYTRYSLYQVGRWGTYPLNGKKAYMPNYTKEKMSDQQMEDLRAYIEQLAK